MSWWTAEYGLVGSLDAPKIYGAGLLSSVGESKHAMTSHVKKIRLSLDCIKYSYNITEPQPQLFVAESMQHLHDVLHELDAMLAYRIGGIEALKRGKEGEAVCTVDLNTKVGITGRLTEFEAVGERVDFIKFAGPVQISYENREMEGQGTARHAHGFSSPIGRLAGHTDRALASMNDNELRELGLAVNQNAKLRFASGFEVNGRVLRLHREKGQLVLVTFTDCSVRKNGQLYFDPAWGEFDMVVGDSVSSVYGGPADREKYGEQEITPAATTPARSTPFTPEELDGIACYQKLRVLRDNLARPGADKKSALQELEQLADTVGKQHAGEWLLQLEVYELAREHLDSQGLTSSWVRQLSQRLEPSKQTSDDTRELVAEGLKLLH
jgi:phenylalanine-4-hydroxylase